jgi:hypothetical protein
VIAKIVNQERKTNTCPIIKKIETKVSNNQHKQTHNIKDENLDTVKSQGVPGRGVSNS